jgi:hypothetical protein
MSKRKLYEIIWDDAFSLTGRAWISRSDAKHGVRTDERNPCHSVGWIIRKTKHYIVLAAKMGNASGEIGSVHGIPKGCIRKIHRLRRTK